MSPPRSKIKSFSIYIIHIYFSTYMYLHNFPLTKPCLFMVASYLFIYFLMAMFEPSNSCIEYSNIIMPVHWCQTSRRYSPVSTRLFEIALCQFQFTPIKLALSFHLVWNSQANNLPNPNQMGKSSPKQFWNVLTLSTYYSVEVYKI